MESVRVTMWVTLVHAILILATKTTAAAQLTPDFYHKTCPHLPSIVLSAVNDTLQFDPVNMPALLRIFYHDCFVNGCEASILLDPVNNTAAEKNASVNLSLTAFDAVDYIKQQVEDACPGVVSCADILAISAQYAISLVGGPNYTTLLGRRDGFQSFASNATAQLPLASSSISQLISIFASHKLTLRDLVTLSGAHTIGFAHCNSFTPRLYNYPGGNGGVDPTMDGTFADQLMQLCPSKRADPTIVQPFDPATEGAAFNNTYFLNIQFQEGLLHSDQALYSNSSTSDIVDDYTADLTWFYGNFSVSIVKMGNIGVLTGTAGQVRTDCHVVNKVG